MKQITYMLVERNESEQKEWIESNLVIIRDLNMGWFEIPAIFKEEFEKRFNVKCSMVHGKCNANITKSDIKQINAVNWNV